MRAALLLTFLALVVAGDIEPLDPPPKDVGPVAYGPLMDAPRKGGGIAAPPKQVFAQTFAKAAFGEDDVPWEIYNSTEDYMVPLGKATAEDPWRNGSGPSICRSGSFNAVSQNDLNKYPASNIGRLYVHVSGGGWAWCSATQIAPDVLITAAHCVFECSTGEWITGGTYYDGRYEQTYRAYSPLKSYTAWTDCDGDNIPIYDFALVRLGTPLYKDHYPATYAPTVNAFSASQEAYVYSYPAFTKSGNIPYFSYQDPVTPSYPADSRAELALSIEAGSSGSAMFLSDLPTANFPSSNLIVGITSYEYTRGNCPNGFAIFQGPEGGYNPGTLLGSLSS
jgi:hypothetical protein